MESWGIEPRTSRSFAFHSATEPWSLMHRAETLIDHIALQMVSILDILTGSKDPFQQRNQWLGGIDVT